MAQCQVCLEKDKMIQTEKDRIEDILAGYKGDKARYLKIIKTMTIAIGCLVVELILVITNGKDGVMIGIDIIKGFFIK